MKFGNVRECIDTKKPTTGRVLLKSRRPHHKQNPLHMQGVSQKTVGGKPKGRLKFRRPFICTV